jgi:hypothetical protein
MSETERYMSVWGEILLVLPLVLSLLTHLIYVLTGELLTLVLMFVMIGLLASTGFWVIARKHKLRPEKRGAPGLFLILVSIHLTVWIWVKVCLVLLGGVLVHYGFSSKRARSQAQNGEIADE